MEKCIKSISNQTFRNFEHIVVDGGSNMQTIDIIKKHSKKISYSISEKDKNMWQAINKGIKASLGSGNLYFKFR